MDENYKLLNILICQILGYKNSKRLIGVLNT